MDQEADNRRHWSTSDMILGQELGQSTTMSSFIDENYFDKQFLRTRSISLPEEEVEESSLRGNTTTEMAIDSSFI